METQKFNVTIRGVTPLILHNGQLADPLSESSKKIKAVSAKKMKTENDLLDMSHFEFLGGLYHMGLDPKAPICLPGQMLEAMIGGGARVTKKGKSASAGLFVRKDSPLLYTGPKTGEALWNFVDENGEHPFVLRSNARVGQSTVMRTRPIFKDWSCTFEVDIVNVELVTEKEIVEWVAVAGRQLGLGDWAPRHRGHYGLFEVISPNGKPSKK